ncbi:MAG: potassium channel family protein [Candidatus Cloacimonetes bacterium]|nr:potassium channel family protein [Candidatus Cloacimonadota bacterium]
MPAVMNYLGAGQGGRGGWNDVDRQHALWILRETTQETSMADWARYEVKILDAPYTRRTDGTVFEKTARVRFFDKNGNEIETIKYAYVTPEEVLADIEEEEGKEINLSYCYVKGFSLGLTWRDVRKGKRVDVNLHHAVFAFFDGGLNFTGTQFGEGNVSFWKARFGEGNVSFWKARFGKGNVDFTEAQFGQGSVSFYMTRFGEGDMIFNRTNFGEGAVDFTLATIDTMVMKHMQFHQLVRLGLTSINKLLFDDCAIHNHIDFSGIEHLGRLEFRHCINPGIIIINWGQNNLEKAIQSISDDKEYTDRLKHRAIAETCLLLKENFRKLGRFGNEDSAYYMFRKHRLRKEYIEKFEGKKHRFFHRALASPKYWFKWVVFEKAGGYGTKPKNILASILITMLLFAGVYHTLLSLCVGTFEGITSTGLLDLKSMADSFYFSAITFLTIGYGDVAPIGWIFRLIASFEGLLGLILISYFTIAFARKVIR